MDKKILVILPAYNEEKSIAKTIQDVKELGLNLDIIVINDGSTDNTKSIAEGLNVKTINIVYNLGIGGAVQTGIKYAFKNNYDIAFQVDSDGQHPPREISKILNTYSEDVDMVIGSRFIEKTDYPSTFMRKLGNKIFSYTIYLITGQRIYDSTTGFRLFGKRAIEFLSKNYPTEFPEPESLVVLLRNGYKIKEVSVSMKERMSGESYVTMVRAIYLMLSITIALLIHRIKKPINKL